jgi:hypothetical protein
MEVIQMTETKKPRYEFIPVYPTTKKEMTDQIFKLQSKLNRRISFDEYLLSLLHGVELSE